MLQDNTTKLISGYADQAPQILGLAGFFQSPEENYFDSETVSLDVERDTQKIAVPIKSIDAQGYENESSIWTAKEITPPIYEEIFSMNAGQVSFVRGFGQSPTDSVEFQQKATAIALRNMRKASEKVFRAIEYQASQIFQTGKLDLKNAAGETVFLADFLPKATHFPTTLTTWIAAGTNLLSDLESLCDVIRTDGFSEPEDAIFGQTALRAFLANTAVRAQLDIRNFNRGSLEKPEYRGQGLKYHGWISVGDHTLNILSYSREYQLANNTIARYLGTDKVIVRAPGRLDAFFGSVPTFGTDQAALPYLPGRIVVPGQSLDLSVRSWLEAGNKVLKVAGAARPVLCPTAIDTFGCLTTTQA